MLNRLHRGAAWWCPVVVLAGLIGCDREGAGDAKSDGGTAAGADKPRIAFVTNQVADFWNIAKAGCEDAQKDFNVICEVKMPSEGTAVEQKRIVEDLLTSGIDAIAISPVEAVGQKDLINQAAAKVPLITHDSDAPGTDRLVYIGMDNYLAGRECGKLVKAALPNGGEVALFIGRLEQDNAKRRRQGVIDELLSRPEDPTRFDPIAEPIRGDKYTIVGTFTDQGDANKGKRNAEDAISTYPNLAAMVGLFEYNPPACYAALQSANKLGQIKLIGFDENAVTLQGIKDGTVAGTVVQNPYQYGYKSVEVLSKLLQGEKNVIPESRFINIPAQTITKENVDAYWADLKAKMAG